MSESEITLVRTEGIKRLGFVIKGGTDKEYVPPAGGDKNGIFVSKIDDGTLAFSSELCVDDQLLCVNGRSLVDVTHADAVAALKSAPETVRLRVRRNLILSDSGYFEKSDLEKSDLEKSDLEITYVPPAKESTPTKVSPQMALSASSSANTDEPIEVGWSKSTVVKVTIPILGVLAFSYFVKKRLQK